MTPEETLRTAAALLRERATGATEGRRLIDGSRATWVMWSSDDLYEPGEPGFAGQATRAHVQVSQMGGAELVAGDVRNWRDAAWIATVHPGLAEPLAAWLDRQADWYETSTASGDHGGRLSDQMNQALPVAREILRRVERSAL